MKKKLISLGIVIVLALGIGNVVNAHGGSESGWSFQEMIPFMKEMHPDMDEQQLKQMYKDCHGSSDEKVPMGTNI
ncbi:CUE domain-containing protein [Oceanobacillus saliphilus]|uniref:CUE domain-containing protein n=1 Tax=Oceanobacillus saliphilus TaxID=2925834 RepID=UPI00201D9B35|nr:CUE domain-containing protein [Oceanobacillus saliphilus]